MKAIHLSIIALAVSAALSQTAVAALVEEQGKSAGLVEDSKLDLLLRNYYFNRDGKSGMRDRRDWSQGAIAQFQSGFTQGTVGVGIDAWAQAGLKLDGQTRYAGTGNMPLDHYGSPQRSYASAGGSLKLRTSQTQLRYGNMQTSAPVFATLGSRLLPQTATGWSLQSSDLGGLDLDIGHYTGTNSGVTTNKNHSIMTHHGGTRTGSATFAGGLYDLTPSWSTQFYTARFDDIWNQYYLNNTYALPLGKDQALTFDANLYRTLDQGQARSGSINNTAWSFATRYNLDSAHAVTLSYQKIHGDTPFDYLGTGDNLSGDRSDSVRLAHTLQRSRFDAPNEASWGIGYNLNMSSYGVPGLSFAARHVRGTGIDGSKAPTGGAYVGQYGANGRHHETDFEARYVLQSGAAKDLSLRLRQAFHRANVDQGEGNLNEIRLIVDYPLNLI